MHERIVEFITALRAAGVRVSLAESLDALRAIEQTGIGSRALFRAALQTTLVKTHAEQAAFQRLFPLYFGDAGVALPQPDLALLSVAEQALLTQALADLRAQTDQPGLAQLLAAAISGGSLRQEALLALLPRPAPGGLGHPRLQRWVARQALRELQLEQLEPLLLALLEQLRAAGVGEQALDALAQQVRANQAALAEQLQAAVLRQVQRQTDAARPRLRPPDELLDQPMHLLSAAEAEELRAAVAQLGAQLRTRVSLRQRRDQRGALDLRGALRASLRYGGVPLALPRRRRRLRPRLVILCDVSSSMRTAASLMLMLVAALHDQVRQTRAFAYIDALHDISADFRNAPPAQAVAAILGRIRAEYVPTDLGSCLDSFVQGQLGSVDQRTTVMILGDGRNNGSDPGLARLQQIKARAHRLIWLTPEAQRSWGSGDSAMLAYAPICDAVHVVQTLRQLSEAVANVLEA